MVKRLNEDVGNLERDITCHTLCDGPLLQHIWDQIDSNLTFQKNTTSLDNSFTLGARIKNLSSLLFRIISFYEQNLGQNLVLRLPDVVKISRNPEDDSSLDDMRLLLLLLLGSAVQCDRKEHFIDMIKSLDLSTQHEIVDCIQQITDNPSSVWINNEWGELSSLPSEEAGRIVASCMSPSKSTAVSSSALMTSSATSPTINNGTIIEQKSHLMLELADLKSKLRRTHQELEEKNELLIEMKEILEQNKETSNKLRQENLELIQEARSAKAYRDEIDVLTERVRKVDRLESEVQRYRDRMNELDFYKSRVEELREDNRILTETKAMLEEQLTVSRKRADQLPELESSLLQLQSYSDEVSLQRDLERDKIESLVEEITQLKVEKKAALEEMSQLQSELNYLRSELNSSECSNQNTHTTNLLEQLNNDAAKRVLKLELENQKLQSLIENMKNNRTDIVSTSSYLNNNLGKTYNFDTLPNGNDPIKSELDENVTPETLSEIDSGCVSLVEELNIRLEKMEKENIRLREASEKLKECELRLSVFEEEKRDLENTVQMLKSKIESDVYKYEQIEDNLSHANTENQRLQRQIDNLQKRLEECQQENCSLESENHKLQQTTQTLRCTMKRLNDLERDVTHLEAENHRLEQEKRSHEKEIMRLKQAIDAKDKLIDDYSGKMSTLELENKHVKKEIESAVESVNNLKKLEKDFKDVCQELDVNKKSLTTLRQDLVNEKIKCQQLNSELDRIVAALRKIGYTEDQSLPVFAENRDWSKVIEDVIDNVIKKSVEQKENKISSLESTLKDACSQNDELKVQLQSLKQKMESGFNSKSARSDRVMIDDWERKVAQTDDENKNLRNENLTFKESQYNLKMEIKSLEMKMDSLKQQNTHLQSIQAKAQVENSLLKAQNVSLSSQISNLEAQCNVMKESRDSLELKYKELENSYRNLFNDHEALQKLHEQLNTDYEVLSASCSTLKTSHKNLRAEHKVVEEQLKAWLVSNEELRKMKEAIENVSSNEDHCNCNLSKELSAKLKALTDEKNNINENYKKLQTEFKMLQNIYKQLRSENNELKLKHTELQGETAECKDRLSSLDVEVSKLSSYCESLSITNNSLEEQRKTLISSVSNLLVQYQDILNEIADNTQSLAAEKLNDLCAKKERLEKMIKEYDNVATKKKKVAVTAPSVVRRIPRSTTDNNLMIVKQSNKDEKVKNRNSCPPIDENNEIYGRIWEAETLCPFPSNAAILRPIRNSSASNSSQEYTKKLSPAECEKSDLDGAVVQASDDYSNKNSAPPRPPPRGHLTTTVENRLTFNLITSPREQNASTSAATSATAATLGNSQSHSNSCINPNFMRGTFRSNTISFGSPIRRQRDPHVSHLPLTLRNGHHHFHHHHHHHVHHPPHSASPSVNSESSVTPHDESELSDGDAQRRLKMQNGSNIMANSNEIDASKISPSNIPRSPSSCTNSIWYEYGCV
ncbi:Protein Daple-like protein [Dinothrombium tinctorium]|uniref:Protein Daple-like protein n=1 Tax=Dinothrombium tinctorium TaxID=1965070 RepID=A0A3S3PEH2_9ACAR|nr:Protein Daple-like protein [Dinothrombium tinctorium]RWS13590.1 Protein Daple-like protein [Dinothrombium tinctorium]